MAKAKKSKTNSVSKKPSKKKKIVKASLIATALDSFPVDIKIDFLSGLGQATAILFRHGLQINMQSISISGDIIFSNAGSGDSIVVNGVCSADARVSISVPTNPTTPEDFQKIITGNYSIL